MGLRRRENYRRDPEKVPFTCCGAGDRPEREDGLPLAKSGERRISTLSVFGPAGEVKTVLTRTQGRLQLSQRGHMWH